MRVLRLAICLVFGLAALPALAAQSAPATAPTTAPAAVQITLSVTTEEGKKQLVATVRAADKAVENATIAFGVQRTFGELVLGQDKTLDDGTAAIAFPSELPAGRTGILTLSATVMSPAKYLGAKTVATIPGGRIVAADPQPFPRALWAPQAPVALIGVILFLLAGAWGAYAFVVAQLVAIRKGAAP